MDVGGIVLLLILYAGPYRWTPHAPHRLPTLNIRIFDACGSGFCAPVILNLVAACDREGEPREHLESCHAAVAHRVHSSARPHTLCRRCKHDGLAGAFTSGQSWPRPPSAFSAGTPCFAIAANIVAGLATVALRGVHRRQDRTEGHHPVPIRHGRRIRGLFPPPGPLVF